jgi:hypothetical protein
MPSPAESGERRSGQHRLLDRQVFVLLEEPEQPTDGVAGATSGIVLHGQPDEGERLVERKPADSRAVASAMTRLPFSIARLKIALGCPCAVRALGGPEGYISLTAENLFLRRPDRGKKSDIADVPGRFSWAVNHRGPVWERERTRRARAAP